MALTDFILTSTPAPHVRVIALNRPEKKNALSQALIDKFLLELSRASQDDEINVIVVTGNEFCFSAGADIKEIAALDTKTAQQSRYLQDLCDGLQVVRKPVIAAVEGLALGGGFELALMCDIILASEQAHFGLPEVKIGLIPGAGGTQRLTNAIGKYRAMQMILLGQSITAEDAKSFGFVSDLFVPGTVLSNSLRVATELAQLSPGATSLAKQAITRSDSLGRDDNLERILYYSAFDSAHKKEGISAFLEKRPPQWS